MQSYADQLMVGGVESLEIAGSTGLPYNLLGVKPPEDTAQFEVPPERAELSDYQRFRIRELASERAKRRCETMKVYEPLPSQLEFHRSLAIEKLAIGANRGTKTTACASELAWAVTGQHPWLSGVEGGYPISNGTAIIVGYDEKHLGEVIFKKLFYSGPGSIKIIRDLTTGMWRSYRPWLEEDKARPKEWRYAPPLIPSRLIDGKIAWRKKGLSIPEKVKLVNGWELNFFSSKAKPVQGLPFHIVWFDEELLNQKPSWYHEMAMRMLDYGGRFMWSATPHVGGIDLLKLHKRAANEQVKVKEAAAEGKGYQPLVTEHFFSLVENPHISDESKKDAYNKLANNPEELRVRFYGEYARLGSIVYPEFSEQIHKLPKEILPDREVPLDWARYAVVDPGRQVCAALFLAVPPPKFLAARKLSPFVLLYDELYLEKANAKKFGSAMEYKTRHQSFEEILIDAKGGRVHDTGSGEEIMRQYSKQLKRHGVWDRVRRRSFVHANCNRKQGIESFREWLLLGKDGCPYVYMFLEVMPNIIDNFNYWSYRKVNGDSDQLVPEESNRHLMDCCRYLALRDPHFRTPKPVAGPKTPAQVYLEKKQERQRNSLSDGITFGPRTHSLPSHSFN